VVNQIEEGGQGAVTAEEKVSRVGPQALLGGGLTAVSQEGEKKKRTEEELTRKNRDNISSLH